MKRKEKDNREELANLVKDDEENVSILTIFAVKRALKELIERKLDVSKMDIVPKEIVDNLATNLYSAACASGSFVATNIRISASSDEKRDKTTERINKLQDLIIEAIYEVYKDTGLIVRSSDGIKIVSDDETKVLPIADEIMIALMTTAGSVASYGPHMHKRNMAILGIIAQNDAIIGSIIDKENSSDKGNDMYR